MEYLSAPITRQPYIFTLRLLISLSLCLGLAGPLRAEPACTDNNGSILILGDSLSAAWGIDERDGWVSQLRERLEQNSIDREVVNASISGETSGGGVGRLPALLEKYQPSLVILELGGNDGLRGYPIPTMRKNLQKAIDLSHQHSAQVLLVGMQIPPNYGPRYSRLFSDTYPNLAAKNQVALVPFFLEGVADQPELMQNDGIHPTEEGQPQMLENLWPALQTLMDKASCKPD
ncbi:arylesterase [Aestuariicella sp. G3-2]|uniref:arylesterase n=1 Tax=Pseudomaricurvus albidus TaxID=2842452 RepID=UPI001C0E2BA3|nr:arylesterase [Aestuariicella albida]MBU3071611.1 arylesterase [Aestuariicella albida]